MHASNIQNFRGGERHRNGSGPGLRHRRNATTGRQGGHVRAGASGTERPGGRGDHAGDCAFGGIHRFPGRAPDGGTALARGRHGGRGQRAGGQPGAPGQPLFQIDPRPFQVALDTALAQLRQAQALADRAQTDFDRAERLVSTGAVSRKVHDEAASTRRARLAQVQVAKAAVAAARLDLSYARITAPIAGRVDRVMVTEGNWSAAARRAGPHC